MIRNKRGQLGETMTWIVATLIIIVLLSISIYVASLLADIKGDTSSAFSSGYSRTQDIVMENSLLAYFSIGDDSIKNEMKKNMEKMNLEEKFPYMNFNEKFFELEEVLE